MTKEERYQQFLDRYEQIVKSGDTAQMERLGEMVRRVMKWLVNYEPEIATAALAIIEGEDARECRNYLTEEEAHAIVKAMDPEPKWDFGQLEDMLRNAGLETSEPPYFNRWALLTTMLMIQSDEGQELKNMLKVSSRDERLLAGIYNLAKARLTDKDGRFNIRRYFELN